MALVKYIQHDGTEHEIEVEPGQNVMQGAMDNLVEGIAAECGGACSCATCHCYIDADWQAKVPSADAIETDMLECVVDPKPGSRLSCQITVTEALDGLVVVLPESQY